jgi:hypothetical protein
MKRNSHRARTCIHIHEDTRAVHITLFFLVSIYKRSCKFLSSFCFLELEFYPNRAQLSINIFNSILIYFKEKKIFKNQK